MTLGLGPAKGQDGATSLGPYLVTPDELPPRDAGRAPSLGMTAAVNGEVVCRGDLADLYWSFGELLAYASRGTELRPGDVIGSGTVGGGCLLELRAGDPARPWLTPGDRVRLEVDVLGAVEAGIVAGAPLRPLR
jgi:2-keto-4-pentenoate hydratase/2-oxohepta-3-ene-1,7-dioic acid hydratase in catechol pathway